jgi:hypothetical protein
MLLPFRFCLIRDWSMLLEKYYQVSPVSSQTGHSGFSQMGWI